MRRAFLLAALGALLLATACEGVTTEPGSTGGNGATGRPAVRLDDDGPVGSLGRALLRPDVGRAVVEIDATEGDALTGRAQSALLSALETFGKKSVEVSGASTVPARDVYSDADLRRLAGAHRRTRSGGGAVSVYVLVLSGSHEDEDALGASFEASSFAIFPERIASGLLPTLEYGAFEEAVTLHELGHLFGLVNLTGEGSFHEDTAHPGHARSRDSVMFWAVEDVSIANVFRGGPPREFDGDDRREMDRIRSG